MPQPRTLIHFTRKDGTRDSAFRTLIWTESGRNANAMRRKIARLRRHSPEAVTAFLRKVRSANREGSAARAYNLASVSSFNRAVAHARRGEFTLARIALKDARMFRERSNNFN